MSGKPYTPTCPVCQYSCHCQLGRDLLVAEGLKHLRTPQVEMVCCACAPAAVEWHCLYTGHAIEHPDATTEELVEMMACKLGSCDHAEKLAENPQYRQVPSITVHGAWRYRVKPK